MMRRILFLPVFFVACAGLNADIAAAHGAVNPSFADHFSVDTTATPEVDRRSESRTFFTFPEWYIVYSAQEYGAFLLRGDRPSQYPFMDDISRFWESLKAVRDASGLTSIPKETKTVLDTIGLSFSFEYAAIGFYESTIGRLSEWLNFGKKSPEDRYVDEIAVRYGDFLLTTPWYEFPYGAALKGLWIDAWGWGSATPRGIERRIAFTAGYSGKALYASAILMATRSTFAPAELETTFEVSLIQRDTLEKIEGVLVLEETDGNIVAKAPRYRAFTRTIENIVKGGGQFESIEGNKVIMATVVSEQANMCAASQSDPIFGLPISGAPTKVRLAYAVPVTEIQAFLAGLSECGVVPEHFYDY